MYVTENASKRPCKQNLGPHPAQLQQPTARRRRDRLTSNDGDKHHATRVCVCVCVCEVVRQTFLYTHRTTRSIVLQNSSVFFCFFFSVLRDKPRWCSVHDWRIWRLTVLLSFIILYYCVLYKQIWVVLNQFYNIFFYNFYSFFLFQVNFFDGTF